jgi:hypothetical protein
VETDGNENVERTDECVGLYRTMMAKSGDDELVEKLMFCDATDDVSTNFALSPFFMWVIKLQRKTIPKLRQELERLY